MKLDLLASEWPQILTSDFKSLAQITYYTMLVLPVLALLWPDFGIREKMKQKLSAPIPALLTPQVKI